AATPITTASRYPTASRARLGRTSVVILGPNQVSGNVRRMFDSGGQKKLVLPAVRTHQTVSRITGSATAVSRRRETARPLMPPPSARRGAIAALDARRHGPAR